MTALVYSPTLTLGFVYEDFNDMTTFLQPFEFGDVFARPGRSLTELSFALSRALSLEAWSYHAVNVALHLVNVALLLRVASLLMAFDVALLVAAVFALHPIQVEAVAYVSARADLVSTAGVLCALWALERERWALVLVSSAAAVLGKETAISVGLLVPLWCWFRQIAVPRWGVSVWLAGVSFAAGYFALRYPLSLSLLDMGGTLMSLSALLTGLVWPFGYTIDPDWRWSQPMLVAGLLWLVAVPGMLAQRSALSCALLWALGCVAPRLVVPLVEGLHQHHLYPVLVGWSLCAGLCLSSLAHRKRVPCHA